MFDLTKAIKSWRKKIQATGSFEDGDAEELESHLAERIRVLLAAGHREEDAFNQAVKETGVPEKLGHEHRFIRERKAWRVSRSFLPELLVSYLKIMIRQSKRYKAYNWITIAGLAIGLTASLFIAFYSLHELSYDVAYTDKPVYRIINHKVSHNGIEVKDAGGPVPLGPTLKEEFPEIKNSVRFWRAFMPTLQHEDAIFQEKKFIFVDPTVFDIFHFEFVQGEPSSVFSLPNSLVISEATAKKYFNTENPVGKVIEYNGYPGDKLSFIVTGVFKNLPTRTHFSFDFLAPFNVLTIDRANEGWGSFKPVWTYVVLNEQSSAAELTKKFPVLIDKYLPDRKKNSKQFDFQLEPVSSIHLQSHANRPMKPGGNLSLIRIMIVTGILILVMSCVNFINISLAKAMVRMKEVSMRKILGAVRQQLIVQFAVEVVVSFIVSLLFSGFLIMIFAGSFNDLTGIELTLESIFNKRFILVLCAIFLFVVLVSGYLPAKTLAGYDILHGLKQKPYAAKNTFSFRNGLIFLQFVISAILILSALIVNDQLSFINQKDLGVKLDRIIAIPHSNKSEVFEARLRSIEGIESVAFSQRLPVNTLNYDGRIVQIPGMADAVQVESSFITPDFIDTYQIELLAGRNLDARLASDSNKFIINETAMKVFGWDFENSIGQKIIWSGNFPGEVTGVVKDFHLESVHAHIQPMVMLNALEQGSWQRKFTSIRLSNEHAETTLQEIEQLWREFNPEGAFYTVSMEDSFKQLHHDDITFSQVILYFTLIAIFISGIGLYAVSSYTAERRRKEIGIRKVLGSGVWRATATLGIPYMITTGLSLAVAVPIVLYGMTKWLNTFAYHTEIKWVTVLLAGLIILILTIVAMLKEFVRIALINPVRFLRDE